MMRKHKKKYNFQYINIWYFERSIDDDYETKKREKSTPIVQKEIISNDLLIINHNII